MRMNLVEQSVVRLLKGWEIEVSMGEPWGFETPEGPNPLEGEILFAKITPEEQSMVLKVTPFRTETGYETSVLDARARYREDVGDLVRRRADGERVPATLDYSAEVPQKSMPEGVEARGRRGVPNRERFPARLNHEGDRQATRGGSGRASGRAFL
jgi:hypothetical protein